MNERQSCEQAAGLPDARRLNIFFPLQNIRGIEIDTFAVSLARVTLWMAHRLAVEELTLDETTLPLVDLSGIVNGDALRSPVARRERDRRQSALPRFAEPPRRCSATIVWSG